MSGDAPPICGRHGPIIRMRPREDPSPEQAWCGAWYDCPVRNCHSSVLVPSAALLAQLRGRSDVPPRWAPLPDPPELPTCGKGPVCLRCGCGPGEKALRAWANGANPPSLPPPMTEAQRGWCLAELRRLQRYDPGEADPEATDGELARRVLIGWQAYARDKL